MILTTNKQIQVVGVIIISLVLLLNCQDYVMY